MVAKQTYPNVLLLLIEFSILPLSQSITHQREITITAISIWFPSFLVTWMSKRTTRSHRNITMWLEVADLPTHHCLTFQPTDESPIVDGLELVSLQRKMYRVTKLIMKCFFPSSQLNMFCMCCRCQPHLPWPLWAPSSPCDEEPVQQTPLQPIHLRKT